MSDIKFDGNDVIVEANVLKVTAFDLVLDNLGRHTVPGGLRRALVHDFGDGVTINWGSDYPGGVTINGEVKLGTLSGDQLLIKHYDVLLDSPERRSNPRGQRRAFVHDFDDGLTLNWDSDYPGGVTINGEVKLGVLSGDQLLIKHYDVLIDSPERRSNPAGQRRALVHDFADGLTINWDSDYPGGVTINGEVKLDTLSGDQLLVAHHTLKLDHPARRSTASGQRRALAHDQKDGLTINAGDDYPGGVTIDGTVNIPGALFVHKLDVYDEFKRLRKKIDELEARIKALEGA